PPAPSGEPPVPERGIVRAQEHVTPVTLEERTPAERSDRKADERASGVPEHPRQDRPPVSPRPAGQGLHDASRYAPAREWEDQLGRNGDRGTFDGHGDDDADVPETTVQRVDEGQHELVDGLDQVSVS